MSVVTLISGGLDSAVMARIIRDEKVEQHPVFIDYGQLGAIRESRACRAILKSLRLPPPIRIDISNWGKTVGSGLTKRSLRIFEDAFLPGRNLMFLLVAASIAYRREARSIAIGLLHDETTIFPDQTRDFCEVAQKTIGAAIGFDLRVITPLKSMTKSDVVVAAKRLGISGTYSCHAGGRNPCGVCVACREYIGIEV